MRGYRQFTWLLVLSIVAGFFLVLTAGKAEQNAARRASFRDDLLKQKAALELGEEVTQRVQMALFAGLTLRECERSFGPLTELSPGADPKHADMTHALFHEKSQRTFYLRFADGKLMGFHSGQGLGEVNTGVVLETPTFLKGEAVRTSVLLAGLVAWCAVLVAGVRVPQIRGNIGVLLVTLALVCGLCWFLAPGYSPTWRGISSNDNLAIFVLLLLASLARGATATRPGEKAEAC